MENDKHVLPEEEDIHSQLLIENLRRAYQPEFQDARRLAHLRERLLAGDGWQERIKQAPLSLEHLQKREKPDRMERQGGKIQPLHLKTGRRALGLVAAILVICFLTGSLLLTLHLAHQPSSSTGPVSPPLPGIIIDLHMFSESTGWALSEGNRVLRTTDGGVNWQVVTPPTLQVLEKGFLLPGTWTFYDPLTAWVEVTTSAQQTPEFHAPTTALLFHTTDGGKTWQETILKFSGQRRVGQLVFVNAHVGWLLSMPGDTIQGPEIDTPFDIWHTTDGGKSWTEILNGSSASAHTLSGVIDPYVSFGDEHVGLMVGQNDRLYRTIDGGVTWQLQRSPAATGNAVELGAAHFFTAKDALFTTTTSGSSEFIVVYTTHDAGLTWQTSPPFSPVVPQNAQAPTSWASWMFIDMQHGWISASTEATTPVTGKSTLVQYRTVDGGQHWTQQPVSSIPTNDGTGFDYASSSFISPSVGWLVDITSGGVILFKTMDGGYTWVQIHAHFPSFIRGSSKT